MSDRTPVGHEHLALVESRISEMELRLDRTERLLGRTIVTTINASLIAEHVARELLRVTRTDQVMSDLSPLLSMMNEQVERLREAVIEAANAK